MNRVLIFVDDDTTSKACTGINPFEYYGVGLGNDIVPVSSIADIDPKGGISSLKYDKSTLRNGVLKLEDGDRALIVGKMHGIYYVCFIIMDLEMRTDSMHLD